jgi:putative lipoic acid-binding regulatory protein
MTTQETPPSLIEFPCFFAIKVMGESNQVFVETIKVLVQTHVPEFSDSDIDKRESSSGKYLSLTCNVWVTSQDHLDTVYRSVTSHPLVKYVL